MITFQIERIGKVLLKRKNPGKAQPRFPMVPAEIWTTGLDEQARQHLLRQILAWRLAAIHWLRSNRIEQLSSGLVDLLLWSLGDEPFSPIEPGPYLLKAFPPALRRMAPEALPPALAMPDHILDILFWRAHLVDFLADAWDTLGSSLFGMEECGYATQMLIPEDAKDTHCPLCLLAYPAGESGAVAHYEQCPVQRRLGPDWDEM